MCLYGSILIHFSFPCIVLLFRVHRLDQCKQTANLNQETLSSTHKHTHSQTQNNKIKSAMPPAPSPSVENPPPPPPIHIVMFTKPFNYFFSSFLNDFIEQEMLFFNRYAVFLINQISSSLATSSVRRSPSLGLFGSVTSFFLMFFLTSVTGTYSIVVMYETFDWPNTTPFHHHTLL